MNLNKFQNLLSIAKNMVTKKASQQEIQDFFMRNGVNATKAMVRDVMLNPHKIKEISLEVSL